DGVITWLDFTILLRRINTDPTSAQSDLSYRAEQAYRALWTSMCDAMDLTKDRVITRDEYPPSLAAMTQDPDRQTPAPETNPAAPDDTPNPLDSLGGEHAPTLSELVEAEITYLRHLTHW